MKPLLAILILVSLAFVASISSSSCSSPASTSTPDTIVLAQLDSHTLQTFTPAFASIGSSDTCLLRLSCGCLFTLGLESASGDTSAFSVADLDTMTLKKTPHRIRIECLASTNGSAATYIFSAVDHFGNTKRDTMLLSANF